jgi:putative Mn2+ efflux pump MntP
VVFGLWDGFSPLVGLLIEHYFGEEIGKVADFVGPIVLLVFGLYLVVQSVQTEAPEELDERWVLFGIPLSLSLDNLLAGTGSASGSSGRRRVRRGGRDGWPRRSGRPAPGLRRRWRRIPR